MKKSINSLFISTDKLFIVDVNECLKFPCGQGTCHNEDGHYWCECPSGLTGTYCEESKFQEMACSSADYHNTLTTVQTYLQL